ncbi:MAG: DUF4179 domain-containing protein [Lachnospiraceae bacterium]|nr:DUF4179 domain-containing protein [Lachnospiraceae bacterium]
MRMDYDDFAAELNRSYPKTPERFQQIVSQEVCAQMNRSKHMVQKRKLKFYKALLPIAACLILAGSTVAAANLPVFQNWLNGLGINAGTAEQLIVHSGETDEKISMEPETVSGVEQEKFSFHVTDAYYDGSTLIFWVATENDYFDLSDHVYINEIDSRLEYVAETEEGSGVYECKVSVVNQELQRADIDFLHVKVGVYTASDEKSDYTFTVESDKFVSALQNDGTVSDLDFGKIVSYTVTVSPSVVNLHLEWEVYEEDMVQILQWGGYILEDASGKRLTDAEWLRSCGSSVPAYDEDRKCTTFTQDLEIVGFDSSSTTMKLIPVRVQWDADGSMIPDSEVILEDRAVTIDLKK